MKQRRLRSVTVMMILLGVVACGSPTTHANNPETATVATVTTPATPPREVACKTLVGRIDRFDGDVANPPPSKPNEESSAPAQMKRISNLADTLARELDTFEGEAGVRTIARDYAGYVRARNAQVNDFLPFMERITKAEIAVRRSFAEAEEATTACAAKNPRDTACASAKSAYQKMMTDKASLAAVQDEMNAHYRDARVGEENERLDARESDLHRQMETTCELKPKKKPGKQTKPPPED